MHKLIAHKWLAESWAGVCCLSIEHCLSEPLHAMGSDKSPELALGGIQEHDEFAADCHSCSALLQGVSV